MEIPNPVQGLKLLKIQCRFWTFLIYNTEKSNLCIDFGRDQTLDQQCKKMRWHRLQKLHTGLQTLWIQCLSNLSLKSRRKTSPEKKPPTL